MKFSRSKVMLAALGVVAVAAVVSFQSPTLAVAQPSLNPEYTQCYFEGYDRCLPRTPGGMVYLPNPDSPEGIAFDMCLAEVEQRCAALYGAP